MQQQRITNEEPKKRQYTRDWPIAYTRNGDVYRIPEKDRTILSDPSWIYTGLKQPIH
jgi:hypothetical protein